MKDMRLNRLIRLMVFPALFLAAPAAFSQDGGMPPQPQMAGGAPVAGIEEDPARTLIIRQLAAIQMRDADLAWSLATADFHEKFSSAQKFLAGVRFEHRPLYNHEDYSFIERHPVEGGEVQKIEVRDRYTGESATVIYRLEQQENGEWLIDSFTVLNAGEAEPI